MALKTGHDFFVAKLLSKLCLLTAATALGFGAVTSTVIAQERSYVLATATVGGTYYPVGVALSTLVLALWTRYVIEGGTYPGQDRDIETVATLSFLAVRADTDEEAVYRITKTIHENLSFLQTIHGALADLSLYSALDGLPAPLHPGALRYYREAGLDIPARLVPD